MELVLLQAADESMKFMEAAKFLGAAIAIAVGVIGPWYRHWHSGGWGDGRPSGRNPEAAGAITTNMILAIAFAEALGIYALIVAVILLFVV